MVANVRRGAAGPFAAREFCGCGCGGRELAGSPLGRCAEAPWSGQTAASPWVCAANAPGMDRQVSKARTANRTGKLRPHGHWFCREGPSGRRGVRRNAAHSKAARGETSGRLYAALRRAQVMGGRLGLGRGGVKGAGNAPSNPPATRPQRFVASRQRSAHHPGNGQHAQ